jgi:hypothetical protein
MRGEAPATPWPGRAANHRWVQVPRLITSVKSMMSPSASAQGQSSSPRQWAISRGSSMAAFDKGPFRTQRGGQRTIADHLVDLSRPHGGQCCIDQQRPAIVAGVDHGPASVHNLQTFSQHLTGLRSRRMRQQLGKCRTGILAIRPLGPRHAQGGQPAGPDEPDRRVRTCLLYTSPSPRDH